MTTGGETVIFRVVDTDLAVPVETISTTMEDLGNGKYRSSFTLTATGDGNVSIQALLPGLYG